MTVTLPALVDGVCVFCADGSHRRCVDPDCECDAGRERGPKRHHLNRPRDTGTPPHSQGEATTTMTPPQPAAITPIDRGNQTKSAPQIRLRECDALPELVKPTMRLADRVIAKIGTAVLKPGTWYELIVYSSAHGSGGAASRLRKDPRFAAYQLEARGSIVYIRLAEPV